MKPADKTYTEAKEEAREAQGEVPVAFQENEAVLYVTKGISERGILDADKAGKKLVFDILDFPTLGEGVVRALSPNNRAAYIMDMRNSNAAERKLQEGKTPFRDRLAQIEMDDPLHITKSRKTSVEGKRDGWTYSFKSPQEFEKYRKAGFVAVKPSDEEVIPYGEKMSGDRIGIRNSAGEIDLIAMRVPTDKLQKHREAVGKASDARLGEHIQDTKEKMSRYSPKVTIFDQSEFKKPTP